MANSKSAKKRILVNTRNQQRNQSFKSRMKAFVRRAKEAISTQQENSSELVKEALRIIDKTVSKGIIKKQTAARKKSRLMISLNKGVVVETTVKKEKKVVAKKAPVKKAAVKAEKKPVAKKAEVKPATKKASTAKAEKKEA